MSLASGIIDHEAALAHAGPDGHVCGPEAALRVFALAARRATGAEHVYITPEHTFAQFGNGEPGSHIIRYLNGPEMREALDRYLLTGELPEVGKVYDLRSPDGAEGRRR